MILDATDLSVEAILADVKITSDMDFVSSYVDCTTTVFTPGTNHGTTNGTTAVTLVAAPAGSTQRQVKWLSIYNNDTDPSYLTVRLNHNNADYRTLWKGVLVPMQELAYTPESKFVVYESGRRILSGNNYAIQDEASLVEHWNVNRIIKASPTLGTEQSTYTLVSDRAIFAYLGLVVQAFEIDHVEFFVQLAGAGAQTAEVALLSSPSSPYYVDRRLTDAVEYVHLTCLVADGTVDDLTTTGMKRNTNDLAYTVAKATHLWVGLRTAMATTQPTIPMSNLAEPVITPCYFGYYMSTAGVLTAGTVYPTLTSLTGPCLQVAMD